MSLEAAAAVRAVLEAMDAQSRLVLRAILLEERDREEICRELGVTAAYLRVLLHRAKKEFLALYRGRNGGPPAAPPPPEPPGPREPRPPAATTSDRPKLRRPPLRLRRPARKVLGL
jgi:RNA polymerase sigma-70 factor (ECF subfamily)